MDINPVSSVPAAAVKIQNNQRDQSEKVSDSIIEGVKEGEASIENAEHPHRLDITV
jgi:hypothetical protein